MKLLKGKRGIIFGALNEESIAWKVAEKAHEHGAKFTLSNTALAMRFGEIDGLAKKTESEIIPADATNLEHLENLFTESMDILGGKIDFILHSIGMSMNVRKNIEYPESNYDFYRKTMDISAISFHKVMQTAYKLDAMSEWGSIVALSYIAAQRTFFGYNDMADAKSLLESIARNFGYRYGVDKKVRVNTISQSPTPTTAGKSVDGFDKLVDFAERNSPLGNATADECADYTIVMFSDLTRKVTMQNLFHDGGYSTTGVSAAMMDQYQKSFDHEHHEHKEHKEHKDHKEHKHKKK